MPGDHYLGTLPGGTSVLAASAVRGRERLTAADPFVNAQSRFDRQARTRLRHRVTAVTPAVYLDFVSSQVMEWSADELASLREILASIAGKFARLALALPPTVLLVKTSGLEEGYAAYTRHDDVIVLPANMVASLAATVSFGDPLHPAANASYLENVIIHEFFHIWSKNNPGPREALYALVDYRLTGNDVAVPAAPWGPAGAGGTMAELKITNPDTPTLDAYIELPVPPEPGSGAAPVRRPLLPVLLASRPYDGGIFFEYLAWWFMALEQEAGGTWAPLLGGDGRPVMYRSAPLLPAYLDRVGRNFTQEIFHPDEILAQSFVLVVNQPGLGLLSEIGRQLGPADG